VDERPARLLYDEFYFILKGMIERSADIIEHEQFPFEEVKKGVRQLIDAILKMKEGEKARCVGGSNNQKHFQSAKAEITDPQSTVRQIELTIHDTINGPEIRITYPVIVEGGERDGESEMSFAVTKRGGVQAYPKPIAPAYNKESFIDDASPNPFSNWDLPSFEPATREQLRELEMILKGVAYRFSHPGEKPIEIRLLRTE